MAEWRPLPPARRRAQATQRQRAHAIAITELQCYSLRKEMHRRGITFSDVDKEEEEQLSLEIEEHKANITAAEAELKQIQQKLQSEIDALSDKQSLRTKKKRVVFQEDDDWQQDEESLLRQADAHLLLKTAPTLDNDMKRARKMVTHNTLTAHSPTELKQMAYGLAKAVEDADTKEIYYVVPRTLKLK